MSRNVILEIAEHISARLVEVIPHNGAFIKSDAELAFDFGGRAPLIDRKSSEVSSVSNLK
jgi:hypothetical protein